MIHQMRSEDDHDADTDAIESDVPLCWIVFFSYFFPTFSFGLHDFKRQLDIESCQLKTAQLGIWDHFFNEILQMCHGFAAPFWVSLRCRKSAWKVPEVASTWASSSFLETKEILGWAILTILESLGGFFFWTSYWFKFEEFDLGKPIWISSVPTSSSFWVTLEMITFSTRVVLI